MSSIHKVAHVMRRFVPDKWGGTESVVYHLSRELIREGIESPVFCTDILSSPGRERVNGVAVHRFRHVLPWLGLSGEDKARLRLKGGSPLSLPLFLGLLRERDISLIHTHVQHRLGGMARTVAKLKRIPYVVSLHGGYFTLPEEQIEKMSDPFRGKLEWGKLFGFLFGARRVLRDADAILCVGENEYAEVRRRFPAKAVHQMPNGVDAARFSKADGTAFREAVGVEESEKIVLCVSRIDYQKNQLGLIRAFAQFAPGHPDHRLVLIGPVTVEAYRNEMHAEIEKLGLGDLITIIEGYRPDDPLLAGAYKEADLFVLSSHHEPFGIVILEAWAAGVPVAAYRVGGIPGFATDGENILMVDKDEETGLAACMARLADDNALRNLLKSNGLKEVAKKYDWPIVARRMVNVYEETIR